MVEVEKENSKTTRDPFHLSWLHLLKFLEPLWIAPPAEGQAFRHTSLNVQVVTLQYPFCNDSSPSVPLFHGQGHAYSSDLNSSILCLQTLFLSSLLVLALFSIECPPLQEWMAPQLTFDGLFSGVNSPLFCSWALCFCLRHLCLTPSQHT